MALLSLTPPVALAEDMAITARRSVSGGAYQPATTGNRIFTAQQMIVCSWDLRICGAGACAYLILPLLTLMAKTSTHLMRWKACRINLMNPLKR